MRTFRGCMAAQLAYNKLYTEIKKDKGKIAGRLLLFIRWCNKLTEQSTLWTETRSILTATTLCSSSLAISPGAAFMTSSRAAPHNVYCSYQCMNYSGQAIFGMTTKVDLRHTKLWRPLVPRIAEMCQGIYLNYIISLSSELVFLKLCRPLLKFS